jgi:hypothetical protein
MAERSGWHRLQLMAYNSAPVSDARAANGCAEAETGLAFAFCGAPLSQPPKTNPSAAVKIAAAMTGKKRSLDNLNRFILMS